MGTASRSFRQTFAVVVTCASLTACTSGSEDVGDSDSTAQQPSQTEAGDAGQEQTSVAAAVLADQRLSTFSDLLVSAGWDQTLGADDPVTVLAPTDEAFAALPPEIVDELESDPQGSLPDLLGFHVIDGTLAVADLKGLDGQPVDTYSGQIPVTVDADGNVAVGAARIIDADLDGGGGGVIQVVDAVILEAGP